MCARMMLSEKLRDAIRIVAFAELDGPPVEPHEVMTRDRATMLAPRTNIRFKRIAPPPRNDRKLRRNRRDISCCSYGFLLLVGFRWTEPSRRGQPLHAGEREFDDQREDRDHDGAGIEHRIVLEPEPVDDETPDTGPPNDPPEGRGSHHVYRRGADASHDERQGDR